MRAKLPWLWLVIMPALVLTIFSDAEIPLPANAAPTLANELLAWNIASHHAHVGDFDGNGQDDLLVVARAPAGLSGVLLSDGERPARAALAWRGDPLGLGWQSASARVIVGRFNRDRLDDVLLQGGPGRGHTILLAQDQVPLMRPYQSIDDAHLGLTWDTASSRVIAGDFDGDGLDDLFVQGLGAHASHYLVRNAGHAAFDAIVQRWDAGFLGLDWDGDTSKVYAGDFNGDRRSDLLVLGDKAQGVRLLLANDQGRFDAVSAHWDADHLGLDWRAGATDLVVADFNHDGFDDVLLQDRQAGANLLLADYDGGFSETSLRQPLADGFLDARWNAAHTPALAGDFRGTGWPQVLLPTATGGVQVATGSDGRFESVAPSSTRGITRAPVPAFNDVGAVQGGFSVETGAAEYSIPIAVPPGRNGMGPNLSLNYNSRRGNGYAGVGWALGGQSAVRRCDYTYAQDVYRATLAFDFTDRLCLNGERLLLENGAPGQSGSTYRTEKESFRRVTLNGNSDASTSSITVETKNGRILTYGGATNSRLHASNHTSVPLMWALSKVEDRFGNSMNFTYSRNVALGELYLVRIDYTLPNASGNTAFQRQVKLAYQNRHDGSTSYIAGARRTISQRLQSIKTFVGTRIVRKYEPVYESSPATGRTVMQYLRECAYSGGTEAAPLGEKCLPATEFEYQGVAPGYASVTNLPGLQSGVEKYQADTPPVDFDGDGFMDLLNFEVDGVTLWRGKADGFHPQQSIAFAGFGVHPDSRISRRPTLDWNEDGKTDFTLPLGSIGEPPPAVPTNPRFFGVENPSANPPLDTNGTFTFLWNDVPGLIAAGGYYVARRDSAGFPIATSPHLSNEQWPQFDIDTEGYDFSVQACNSDDICSDFTNDLPIWVDNGPPDRAAGDSDGEQAAKEPAPSRMNSQTLGVMWFDANDTAQLVDTGIAIDVDQQRSAYHVLDVNGDGRQDIVTLHNDQWKIHLRSPDPQALDFIEQSFPVSAGGDIVPHVVDFNGDGRMDMLMERDNAASRVLISQSTRFVIQNDVLQRIPPAGIQGPMSPLLADFNNDGLTDAILPKDGGIEFHIGTGDSFVFKQWFGANSSPFSDNGDRLGYFVKAADYDADGDLDLFVATDEAACTNTVSTDLKDGYGWEIYLFEDGAFDSANPVALGHDLILGTWRILDLKGDGVFDIVANKPCQNLNPPPNHPDVYLSDAVPADLLTKITNGLDAQTHVRYAPLNDSTVYAQVDDLAPAGSPDPDPATFPALKFSGSMPVVAEVEVSNGIAAGRNLWRYNYWNARMDLWGRGFQGFERTTVTDVAGGVVTDTTFHMSFPLTGLPREISQYVAGIANPAQDYLAKTTYDWSHLSSFTATWSSELCFWEGDAYLCETLMHTSESRGFIVRLNETVQTTREPADNYADVAVETRDYSYDAFENVHIETVTVDNPGLTSFVAKTTSVYDTSQAREDEWWLNRLSTQTVEQTAKQIALPRPPAAAGWTAVAGGSEHRTVRSTSYAQFAPDSPFAECVASHRGVCRVTVEPLDAQLEALTTYDYDGYGNVTLDKLTSSNTVAPYHIAGRATQFAYDTSGYFAATVTNAENHVTTLAYDEDSGRLVSMTDPNGDPSTLGYDNFGRQLTSTTPGDPTQSTTYAACGGAVACYAHAKYRVSVTQAGRPDSELHYDMHGRLVESRVRGFDGAWIKRRQSYDSVGRLTHASEPYRTGGTIFETVFSGYDVLDRPNLITRPDSQTVGYAYGGLTTTMTRTGSGWAPLVTTEQVNSFGQLMQVTDAGSGVSYYRYDSLGNLVFTRDADGHDSWSQHDRLGRRIQSSDPDAGLWTAVYDVAGQLKEQTDGNLEKRYFEYDKIGRLTSRDEDRLSAARQTVGTWTYDIDPDDTSGAPQPVTPFIGRLSRVTGSSSDYSGFTEAYTYDGHGRRKDTRTTLDVGGSNQEFVVTRSYHAATGLLSQIDYPTDFGVKFEYSNAQGYLTHEKTLDNQVLRHVTALNARQQIKAQTFGQSQSISNTRLYDDATGLLTETKVNCVGAGSCPSGELQRLSYTYDGFNNLLSRTKHTQGVTEHFDSYDNRFRLTGSHLANSGGTVSTMVYDYSPSGNLTEKNDFAGTYHYDGVRGAGPHGVSSVDLIGGGNVQYSYDGNGNLTDANPVNGGAAELDKSIDYSLLNKPTRIDAAGAVETFRYSPDDWRWKKTVSEGGATSTTYYVGKLFEYIVHDGDNGEQLVEQKHYVGDYLVYSQRSSSTNVDGDAYPDGVDNCRLVHFDTADSPDPLCDTDGDGVGNRCDADLNNDGAVNPLDLGIFRGRFFASGPNDADFNCDLIVNPLDLGILRDRFFKPVGPGALETGDAYEFLLTDNLGSVDAVATETNDGAGLVTKVKERLGFAAFGESRGGNWVDPAPGAGWAGLVSQQSAATSRGFTGHEHLAGSGLIHMNGRAYDPKLGRFLSADPIISDLGNGQTLNPYSYLANNPLSGTDPTGYEGISIIGTIKRVFQVFGISLFGGGSKNDTPTYVNYTLDRHPISSPNGATASADADGYGRASTQETASDSSESTSSMVVASRRPTGRPGVRLQNQVARDQVMALIRQIRRYNPDFTYPVVSAGRPTYTVRNVRELEFELGRARWEHYKGQAAGIPPQSPSESIRTRTSKKRGWRTGDPINNRTYSGNTPTWRTVRERYWKNEAYYNPGNYSRQNLELMRKGRPPQRINPRTGEVESMELDHSPAQRDGGLYDVVPVWPAEHAARDPHRRIGGQ